MVFILEAGKETTSTSGATAKSACAGIVSYLPMNRSNAGQICPVSASLIRVIVIVYLCYAIYLLDYIFVTCFC